MVHTLVEGLIARGNEVILVGAGTSQSSAKFLQTYEAAPIERLGEALPEIVHALVAGELLKGLEVDVVHDHSVAGPLMSAWLRVPWVITAHGPIAEDLEPYYRVLGRHAGLVAISDSQRATGPHLPWTSRIYNAIPVDQYPFETEKEEFCLFLGRISAEKAPDLAIKAARRAGYPIVVAAKCNEPPEKRYFEERVRPLLGPDAESTCRRRSGAWASSIPRPAVAGSSTASTWRTWSRATRRSTGRWRCAGTARAAARADLGWASGRAGSRRPPARVAAVGPACDHSCSRWLHAA